MAADAGITSRLFSVALGPARLHSAFGDMNKWQIICPLAAMGLVVLTLGVIHERSEQRRFMLVATSSVAWDLVHMTNSELLATIEPKLHASLSELLASTGFVAQVLLGDDQQPSGGGKACSRFTLTNRLGYTLAVRLGRDPDPKAFRILSYKVTTEPDGAAKRSQPVRAGTNRTSAAAGSGR